MVSFSSQMLLSDFYVFVSKPDNSSDIFIPSFILPLFLCAFFECLCSFLWNLGGGSRTKPLLYISSLYLSYCSCSSSLLNQWSWPLVIITPLLKRSRITTPAVGIRFLLSNVYFSLLSCCFQVVCTSLYTPLFLLFLCTFSLKVFVRVL